MKSLLVFFILFIISFNQIFPLRVYVVNYKNGSPSLWSVSLADPDDSASEQEEKELFTSSTVSQLGYGIAYNTDAKKILFQATLSVIPNDNSRTLQCDLGGKDLTSVNSICGEDLIAIASAGNFTYTVGANMTLFQGGLEDSDQMIPLMTLPGDLPPTFMKFYQDSLYYTNGLELLEIPFNTTENGEYLPSMEPAVVFQVPEASKEIRQFDFDPTINKYLQMYFANGNNQIISVNMTADPVTFQTYLSGLKNPIGCAVGPKPHYLFYTAEDALYQYDFDSGDTSELYVLNEVYGITCPASTLSLSFSLVTLFSLLFLLF